MNDDDLGWKITRVAIPIFIYFGVSIFIQSIMTFLIIYFGILKDAEASVYFGYTLLENMDKVVSEYSLLITLVTALVTIPIMLFLMKRDGAIKFFSIPNMSGYGMLIVLGILGALGLARTVQLFPIDGILGNYAQTQSAMNSAPILLQFITLVIAVPVMEEFIFRGLIYSRIKIISDSVLGIYISALIFGIYHMNLVQGLYAFAIGIILAIAYEYHASILAPIVLHISANLMSFIMNHNAISEFITTHLVLRIVVTLIELGLFILALAYFILGIDKNKKETAVL